MSPMLDMLRDLVAHKGYANAALLGAIRQNDAAAADPELRELLQHMLIANRFWLLTVLGQPFVFEEESRAPGSFDGLIEAYYATQEQEHAWFATATEADLARQLASPLIPGGQCSVSQAYMQVCLHTLGHRAQCAKLLRRHGGVAPTTDFILWLASRSEAAWPLPVGEGKRERQRQREGERELEIRRHG
jgi:uncharacterized damage-inducible protein DinB